MESMTFHQPVSTSRVRANTLLSSLPTNIVNEILDIINQELKSKIVIYRDQMLTYAQEIDEKLSNCKDSRNKYYQICQQLTTKYSKLKKKYEHLYTRYQSYKARNKELFNLLQYLSSEDIRVQHQILKYQSKYRNAANHANAHNLNINTINISANTNREPSPSISAISSPSYNNGALTIVKRHSKSKTATSIPFRNSLLINDPHKLLTHQPSALSAAVKHSNPFSGYYNGNSYKRNSNSERSHASRSTMSIHENEDNDEPDDLFGAKREREHNNLDDAYGITLTQHTELEGYHDTTLNHRKQKKQKASRYSSTVQTPPVTMRQSNFSDDELQSNNSSLQIQPVAMPASLFITNEYNKMNSSHLQPVYSPKNKHFTNMRKNAGKKDRKAKKRYSKQSIAKKTLLANVLRADNEDLDEYDIANGTMFRKHHLRELNSMIVNASSDDDEYEQDDDDEEEEEDHNMDEEEEDTQNVILHDEDDREHMLNSNSDHHDNQASGSSTKQDRNSSNIDYSRSHSSSMLSGFTEEDQTRTQQFYYEQLKLTPVPTKRVIDKNRLIGILQNLPMDEEEDINRGTSSNDTPIEDVMDDNDTNVIQHHPETAIHSRNVSSHMSFPDIDKINHSNDNSKSSSSSSETEESEQHLAEQQTNEVEESEYFNPSEQEMDDIVPQMNEKFSRKKSRKSHNSHMRSSTFGSQSHIDKSDKTKKRSKSNNGNIGGPKTGKTIKLFYRFGTKSYPPIMAKTTNTIQQLKALIASCLQNVDPNKLQLAHRQRVLNDMNLTLSQCDIAQYDTIIAKIDTTRLFPEDMNEKEVVNMVISPRVNSAKSTNSFAFHNNKSNITPISAQIKASSMSQTQLWTPHKTPQSAGSRMSPYPNNTPPPRKSLMHANSNQSHTKRRKKKRKSPPIVTVTTVEDNEEEEYDSYHPTSERTPRDTEDEDEDDDIHDMHDDDENNMINIADNIHNHLQHASMHSRDSRRPLFGISRPVSMRKYDDSIEYPLSVCPASIAVQSPRHCNKTQRKPFADNNNNHLLSPRKIPSKKKKKKKNTKRVRKSPRVRFSTDTKYNIHDPEDHNLLELRRNLSRSLDVRIEDHMHNDKAHHGRDYHNGDETGSFSPLPSRRRTQKLDNPPLVQLMNTANCKKSKSLSISKNKLQKKKKAKLKRNRLKTRSFSTKPARQHAPKHSHNHIVSDINLSVTSIDDEMEEEERQQAMELQRNVSREDLDSGDDISTDNFPNYDDRERRKTIEIGKPPLK